MVEVELSSGKVELKEGLMLYCPSHGPGKVVSIKKMKVLGEELVFCQMEFEDDDMKLSIPLTDMKKHGIRTIVSKDGAKKVLNMVLDKPAKNSKVVWQKRITEYQTKLDSGGIIFIAEVVRDLYNRSYLLSERTLYDKALDRLVRELSIALNCTVEEANKMVIDILSSNCKTVNNSNIDIDDSDETTDDFSDDDDIDESDDVDNNEKKRKVA